MWRVPRKLLGSGGGLEQRRVATRSSFDWSYPESTCTAAALLRHTSSTTIVHRDGDGDALPGYSRLRAWVIPLSSNFLAMKSIEAEFPLWFQEKQHFAYKSYRRYAMNASRQGKQSHWDDRKYWFRTPVGNLGQPLYNVSTICCTHRLRQQEAASFFSSSSLRATDGNEKARVDEVSPAVKVRPTPPRIHPNLLKPLEKTRVPTPNSGPESLDPLNQLSKTSTRGMLRKGLDLMISAFRAIVLFSIRLPGNLLYFATRPMELKDRLQGFWEAVKHEANHYWVGTKLLWEEMKTARMLVGKTLDGTVLSRRERKQLLRTVSDLFRLVPFSMFILIPFMEFALPFALRLFPNMLPSTYQDSLKAEENMKRELKSRIAMAQFFQE